MRLLRALGSRYHYNALAQELTGIFWAHGRATGRQYLFTVPDEERADGFSRAQAGDQYVAPPSS